MRDKNKNNFRENIKEIGEAILDANVRIGKATEKAKKESFQRIILSDWIDKTITHYSVRGFKGGNGKRLLD